MVLYIGEIYKSKRTSVTSITLLYMFAPKSTYFVPVAPAMKDQHIPWWNAPIDLTEGSLWIFDFLENPVKQEAVVKFSTPLIEVIDLRMYERTNPFDIIKELGSIKLPFIPSARVYLWLKEGMWCGPVVLTKDISKGRWVINIPLNDIYIPLVDFSYDDLAHLPQHPDRLFVSPWYKVDRSFSFVDIRTSELICADNTSLEVLMDLKITDVMYNASGKVNPNLITPLVKHIDANKTLAKTEFVAMHPVKGAPKRGNVIVEPKKQQKETKKAAGGKSLKPITEISNNGQRDQIDIKG